MTTQQHVAVGPSVEVQGGRLMAWVKKLGVWGFLFFFVKGLLWLAVPWLVLQFR